MAGDALILRSMFLIRCRLVVVIDHTGEIVGCCKGSHAVIVSDSTCCSDAAERPPDSCSVRYNSTTNKELVTCLSYDSLGRCVKIVETGTAPLAAQRGDR